MCWSRWVRPQPTYTASSSSSASRIQLLRCRWQIRLFRISRRHPHAYHTRQSAGSARQRPHQRRHQEADGPGAERPPPSSATAKRKSIPIDEVAPGDLLLVKPGERIPVDAIVTDGRSAVDESMLTGESLPVDKTIAAEVYGGTINQQGRLVLEAQRVGRDTVLWRRSSASSKHAQGSKAPIQAVADRVAPPTSCR